MKRAALVAAMLLSGLAVAQAATPNQDSVVLEADGDVRALALADDQGWIAAGIDDPTARDLTDPDSDADDADTWFWWNHLYSQFQSGSADRTACQEGSIQSCQTDVVDMDLSDDGRSLVVLAVDGSAEVSTVLFWDANAGQKARFSLGTPGMLFGGDPRIGRAVDMSDDGRHIVVAAHIPGGDDGETALYKYTWDRTNGNNDVAITWSYDGTSALAGEPFDVAISEDGARVSVAAEPHARILSSGATVAPSSGIAGQALSVDFSHDTVAHWSVAGFAGGEVALYNTQSESGSRTAVFTQRPVNNVAQTHVAIAGHGQWFAAGSQDGTVRLYLNPLVIDTVTPLVGVHGDLGGPVRDLEFSDDGRYLVVAAGDNVHFFRTDEGVFERYWLDALELDEDADVRHVAINDEGSLVVAAAGAEIFQYRELKGFELTLPATKVRVSPANSVIAELIYENTGNREATVDLTAAKPTTDWTLTFDDGQLQVPPGATETFQLTIVAPVGAPAQDETIAISFRVNGEDLGTRSLPIQVLQEQVWGMERVSSEVLSLDPGRSASFAVNVTNLGNDVDSTQILAEIDAEGWGLLVDPEEMELDPGATRLVTLRATAPADAKEGDTAEITVSTSVDESASTTFEALVGADYGVQFAILTPEDVTLFPGNTTTLRLHLSNPGNALDSYRVETAGVPAGWTIRFPDDQNPHTVFSVLPGDDWEVPVEITATQDAEPGNYQVAFRATSLGDTGQSSVAKSVLVVEEAPEPEPKGKDSPGFEVVALLALLAAIAVLLRRKR